MSLLRWLGLDPCSQGHMPVLMPPLHEDLQVGRCGRCGRIIDRCMPGWCVERDGSCIKCGWPADVSTS